MAKRGGSRHYKRLTVPTSLPVVGRKHIHWLLSPKPGPHPRNSALALGVLLRDSLHVGVDLREVKKSVVTGSIKVDGKIVRDIRRPIGLMDIIEIPKMGKTWRMQIAGGRLSPKEIEGALAKHKLCKVTGKRTITGKQVQITLHDGRTMKADDSVKMGATLALSVPAFKIEKQLAMAPGVRCLITKGKHAGEIAVLENVIERVGSMDSEAKMKSGGENFITVTKYLFVVDDQFA